MKTFLILLYCSYLPFSCIADEIKSFVLKNGMKFILLKSSDIPNANMYTYWKVGSRNESPGISGLSHFFEHMMFNGTKKYAPKQFDKIMEGNGGANNAYTSNDLTVYQDWFPSSALEIIFELESDRIANLKIDKKMLESERGVVLSERSTGLENSNFRALYTEVYASAFVAHPYNIPTIGHESDIKAWALEDLIKYFKTYYSPQNAVAVIVGDINTTEVEKLAKKYFSKIPNNNSIPKIRTIEPLQKGQKTVFIKKESASSVNMMISFKVPQANHPDYFIINLIEGILAKGKTSRFYKSLVNTNKAIDFFIDHDKTIDQGLFNIGIIASKNIQAKEIEEIVLKELEMLKIHGPEINELQKVKNKKVLDYYRKLETINGKASLIGESEIFWGDYRLMYKIPEQFKKITANQIKEALKKYFTKNNSTIGILAATE